MKLKGTLSVTGQNSWDFEVSLDRLDAMLSLIGKKDEPVQDNGYRSINPKSKGDPTAMTRDEADQLDRAAAKREMRIAIHDGKRGKKKQPERLGVDTVIEIARLLVTGFSYREIENDTGVRADLLRNIHNGWSWTWLTGFVHQAARSKKNLYDPKYFGWDLEKIQPGPEALKRMRHRFHTAPNGKKTIRFVNPFIEVRPAKVK